MNAKPSHHPLNIAIICLDTLGDLVLRQPLFSGLLNQGHRVTVVVREEYEQAIPHLDPRICTMITDFSPYAIPTAATWAKIDNLCSRIGELKSDVLVSALFSRTWVEEWIVSQFPHTYRIGMANRNNPNFSVLEKNKDFLSDKRPASPPFFDELILCDEVSHECVKNLALLNHITKSVTSLSRPKINASDNARSEAAAILGELGLQPGKYVIGVPGGNSNIGQKYWPVQSYTNLVVNLKQKYELSVLMTGLEIEAPVINDIKALAASNGVSAFTWIGDPKHLYQLLGLIHYSCFYLGTDTGTMHLAAALNKPVVALFGGGTWPRFLPMAKKSFVLTQKLPCFGCNWKCFFDKPICMVANDQESLDVCLDWIIEAHDDGNMIDTGREITPDCWAILRHCAEVVDKHLFRLEDYETYWLSSRLSIDNLYDKMKATDDNCGIWKSVMKKVRGYL